MGQKFWSLVRQLFVALAVGQAAFAADQFVVTSVGDEADADPGDDHCVTSVGTCTLRAAIEQANHATTFKTITFNLPPGDYSISPVWPLEITKPMVIDGTTQPGFDPVTKQPLITLSGSLTKEGFWILEINGVNAEQGDASIVSHALIKGLAINNSPSWGIFIAQSRGVLVQGCYLGLAADGVTPAPNGPQSWNGTGIRIVKSVDVIIGGDQPGMRNVIYPHPRGIVVLGSSGIDIKGNYIGVDWTGSKKLPIAAEALGTSLAIVGSHSVNIGGLGSEGNVISGQKGWGLQITGSDTKNVHVIHNFIGLDAKGAVAIPNTYGIEIQDAGDVLIGDGTLPGRNVISGNTNCGLCITHTTDSSQMLTADKGPVLPYGWKNEPGRSPTSSEPPPGNTGIQFGKGGGILPTIIRGNFIGTDATGKKAVGNNYGVSLNRASLVLIGGVESGDANLIAANHDVGIKFYSEGFSFGSTILRNKIVANGSRGIHFTDVSGMLPVPNDPGDGDEGPNGLQNHPVLTSAVLLPSSLRIEGSLDSRPLTTYHIEFFANTKPHPTGVDQGELFLGSVEMRIPGEKDANGTVVTERTFAAELPLADIAQEVKAGHAVTAIATSCWDPSADGACDAYYPPMDLQIIGDSSMFSPGIPVQLHPSLMMKMPQGPLKEPLLDPKKISPMRWFQKFPPRN